MARLDAYLKKMAGGDNATPAPQNDLDKSLNTLAESGGGSDTIVLHFGEDGIADKTITEVLDALRAGKRVIWVDEGDGYLEVNEVYSYVNDGTEELPHGFLNAFVATYDSSSLDTTTYVNSADVNPVDGSIWYQ